MFTVLAFLAAGGAIGWALCALLSRRQALPQAAALVRAADSATGWAVLAMLVALGMSAGSRSALMAALPEIGLRAAIVCLGATLGSVIVVRILIGRGEALAESGPVLSESSAAPAAASGVSSLIPPFSVQTLLAFALGLGAGRLFGAPPTVPLSLLRGGWSDMSLDEAVLHLLLLLVGFSAGMDRRTWKTLAERGPGLLIAPLVGLAGACLGGLAIWPLIGGGLGETLAAASGMGYYSLTAGLVAAKAGEAAGFMTLAANLLRETLTLVGAPLVRRWLGPWAAVAAGGATTVDTTLPILARTCGPAVVGPAIVSGATLSLFAPLAAERLVTWLGHVKW